MLKEPVELGQRIEAFSVQLIRDGKTVGELKGSTIGHKRILTFPEAAVDSFNIVILQQKTNALLREVSAYLISGALLERN